MLQELNDTEKTNNITWASIANGLIVVKTSQDDPRAKSRINKMGNQVWEHFYRSIGGKIQTISIEENKFQEKDIKVGLKNDENIAVLTIKLNSSYGRSFLSQIFNADLTKNIEFTPWSKVKEDGSKVTRLYMGYGKNQPIEYKLPDNTPQVKFVEIKGKSVVDNISQIQHLDFLEESLSKYIINNKLVYEATETKVVEMVKLTPAEQKELKEIKAKVNKEKTQPNIKYGAAEAEGSMDDFFNDL